ncbi:MAG: hypothetical protein OEZ38_06050 [Gammaproteobacteria bacterium]|nr:hypothetical protein [Gammaproteobacteria bacterium]
MNTKITDVMLQIDGNIDTNHRHQLETYMKQQVGVTSLGYHDNKQQLMMVGYNPECITAADLLTRVKFSGVQAELINLYQA